MKISYDKEADVLYLWFSLDPPPYINIENRDGDVLRIKESDGTVVGSIIFDAMARLRRGKAIDVPEVGSVPMNQWAQILLSSSEIIHAVA
jgi:uncharacterized protein YuzE